MSKSVAIIGLGYVGLPLAIQFAKAGVRVVGFDLDQKKVSKLNAGESYILHIPSEDVSNLKEGGNFLATCDYEEVGKCDAAIICVPTPLGAHREPDISYILETGRSLGPHLHKGMLVVLESTTYPGTTDTDLRQALEETSGLKAGTDFHLAYSPEREDPGNPNSKVAEIPKVIGGLTPECLEEATHIYSKVIKKLVPVSSTRIAEAVKLTENIFRSVNIAMVNELKMVYDAMGIDIWEVIEAAKTKPFGFMPFYPGPGLGGHCIPIDPFYLTWKAHEHGQPTRFIELAGEVNTSMPNYVVHQVMEVLSTRKKAVNGSRILIIGIAYKSNVDDDRESPAYILWKNLAKRGAEISYHDPHVPVIRPSREHSELAGIQSTDLTPENIASFDLVLLATKHDAVDHQTVADHAQLIIDTRNAFHGVIKDSEKYFKA